MRSQRIAAPFTRLRIVTLPHCPNPYRAEMARVLAVAVAACVAVTEAIQAAPPACFDEYQCTYHQGTGSSMQSWDLRPLCR